MGTRVNTENIIDTHLHCRSGERQLLKPMPSIYDRSLIQAHLLEKGAEHITMNKPPTDLAHLYDMVTTWARWALLDL